MNKYIIALKDTDELEANWVYKVERETDTHLIVTEDWVGSGFMELTVGKDEAIAEITKEQFDKLESLLDEDGYDDYLGSIIEEKLKKKCKINVYK